MKKLLTVTFLVYAFIAYTSVNAVEPVDPQIVEAAAESGATAEPPVSLPTALSLTPNNEPAPEVQENTKPKIVLWVPSPERNADTFDIDCPACKGTLRYSASLEGETHDCPDCNKPILLKQQTTFEKFVAELVSPITLSILGVSFVALYFFGRHCRIRKTLGLKSALLLALLAPLNVAHADMLSGKITMSTWSQLTVDGSKHNVYVTPMTVTNLTTGQDPFLLFCGDFLTSTTAAYSSATGEEYNSFALASDSIDFYQDRQKAQLDALFGHAYATAFDLDGNVLNTTNAQAIQLAIWSIIHEESGNYDILDGSFKLTAYYDQNVVEATNRLLQAVLGEVKWEDIGMEQYMDYDLTVYVAAGGHDVSQTLISVTGSVNREPFTAATPEPATFIIFALGVGGSYLIGRRHRKEETESPTEVDGFEQKG
jgi:uncharacterized protein YbaR (Trm112 family)